MRRVLHLRMASQCAMLEDFGIFLVLADNVCDGQSQFTGISLTSLAVALCISYRSTCALVTWSGECFTDTPETQREQGCAVLHRREPWRKDVGYLYEEEERG